MNRILVKLTKRSYHERRINACLRGGRGIKLKRRAEATGGDW